ncbi:MAG: sigma-70 family RNA polymerase sigma factor [Clostridia bacterium]|nr:sigma-70 family RNA polymerase sigma factor [Clostridia bacterium]
MVRKYETEELEAIERAKDFLCGYRLCMDMLDLRKYERRRLQRVEECSDCADILAGDEAYWRARIYAIGALLGKMKNGREKLLLYYHYIKGESVERAAALIGVSRRTAFRIHQRALLSASYLLPPVKKSLSSEIR